MSNRVHLVLRIDQQAALAWETIEVSALWNRLFGGNPLVRSFVAGEQLSEAQARTLASSQRRLKQLCNGNKRIRGLDCAIQHQLTQDKT